MLFSLFNSQRMVVLPTKLISLILSFGKSKIFNCSSVSVFVSVFITESSWSSLSPRTIICTLRPAMRIARICRPMPPTPSRTFTMSTRSIFSKSAGAHHGCIPQVTQRCLLHCFCCDLLMVLAIVWLCCYSKASAVLLLTLSFALLS